MMGFFGGKPKKKKLSRNQKLKEAFSTEISESKLRGMSRQAREAAIEGALRRVERRVDAETQRRVAEAEERAARIFAAREAAAEQRRQQRASRAQKRRENAEERTACTCRKPAIGKDGKCTRCRKKPAGRTRRRR